MFLGVVAGSSISIISISGKELSSDPIEISAISVEFVEVVEVSDFIETFGLAKFKLEKFKFEQAFFKSELLFLFLSAIVFSFLI